jgi:hypothetical protein
VLRRTIAGTEHLLCIADVLLAGIVPGTWSTAFEQQA